MSSPFNFVNTTWVIRGGVSGFFADVNAANQLQVTSSPASGSGSNASAPWTSATGVNSALVLLSSAAYSTIVVQFDTTGITGGAVTFEGTFDGTNWVPLPSNCTLNPITSPLNFAQFANPLTLPANANTPVLLLNIGYAQVRARLSTAITGAGQVIVYWTLSNVIDPAQLLGAVLAVTSVLSVSAADGALATIGSTTDAAASGDTNATVEARLRGNNLNMQQHGLQQQRRQYTQQARIAQSLCLQSQQSFGYIPVPEIPEFLGEY